MNLNYLWQSCPKDEFVIYDRMFTTSIIYHSRNDFVNCHACAVIQIFKTIQGYKENILIGSEDFREEFLLIWDSLFTNVVIVHDTYIKIEGETDEDIRKEVIDSQTLCDLCNKFCCVIQTSKTKRIFPTEAVTKDAAIFILSRNKRIEIQEYIDNITNKNIFTWEFLSAVKFCTSHHIFEEVIKFNDDFWSLLKEARKANSGSLYEIAAELYKSIYKKPYEHPMQQPNPQLFTQ